MQSNNHLIYTKKIEIFCIYIYYKNLPSGHIITNLIIENDK